MFKGKSEKMCRAWMLKTTQYQMKEIKEYLSELRDILTVCLWTGRIGIVIVLILPNLIHKFNTISITISTKVVCGYSLIKVYMKRERN